ncbi:hypothetical protein [Candidatus Hodgkinia cicadicola]
MFVDGVYKTMDLDDSDMYPSNSSLISIMVGFGSGMNNQVGYNN